MELNNRKGYEGDTLLEAADISKMAIAARHLRHSSRRGRFASSIHFGMFFIPLHKHNQPVTLGSTYFVRMPELFVGTNAKLFQRRCKTKQRAHKYSKYDNNFRTDQQRQQLCLRGCDQKPQNETRHDEPFPAHSATDRCRINATKSRHAFARN